MTTINNLEERITALEQEIKETNKEIKWVQRKIKSLQKNQEYILPFFMKFLEEESGTDSVENKKT